MTDKKMKIFIGPNSLHCKVAATSYLKDVPFSDSEELSEMAPEKEGSLCFIGDKSEDEGVYYFAAKKDWQLIPTIISSLQELYKINHRCEYIKVETKGLLLTIMSWAQGLIGQSNLRQRIVAYCVQRLSIKQIKV